MGFLFFCHLCVVFFSLDFLVSFLFLLWGGYLTRFFFLLEWLWPAADHAHPSRQSHANRPPLCHVIDALFIPGLLNERPALNRRRASAENPITHLRRHCNTQRQESPPPIPAPPRKNPPGILKWWPVSPANPLRSKSLDTPSQNDPNGKYSLNRLWKIKTKDGPGLNDTIARSRTRNAGTIDPTLPPRVDPDRPAA